MPDSNPRLLAFYLPQFHPIPENDTWWGKGFTEWTNVVKARPRFRGHFQPHLPADLGFYDLRLPEARLAQAELARAYGISGFCYYHYWFGGKRILERPFQEVLASGEPDFPFCLCWANENWTRRWDGAERDVLLQQVYSEEDDRRHIRSLLHAFEDPRYIRLDDRPLFLVYKVNDLPEPRQTAERWREEARRAGISDLYICSVISDHELRFDPADIGFDALVEFPPNSIKKRRHRVLPLLSRLRYRLNLAGKDPYVLNRVFNYRTFARELKQVPAVDYKIFPSVMPGWDNSARKTEATIFVGSSPESYGDWLRSALQTAKASLPEGERLVFINAWNEWAEGNHLEPDDCWGRAFLEETLRCVSDRQTDQRSA